MKRLVAAVIWIVLWVPVWFRYVRFMVDVTEIARHGIGWVDLAANDLDGAREFYAGLMGWDIVNDGQTPYWMCTVKGQPVAGMMAIPPEMGAMPSVWNTYVTVDNAEATVAATTEAGGQLLQPIFDVPGGARIAVIADPAGAAICVFEGLGSEGIKLFDEVGAPCWFDCASRDVHASVAFYAAVFGWTTTVLNMGMEYTVFHNNGVETAGAMQLPDEVPAEVPSYWGVNFVVDDADRVAAWAASNGATLTMPPSDTPFGRACGVMDPWGAVMNLIDRSSAVSEFA